MPKPAKLIIALLARNPAALERARGLIEAELGTVELSSPHILWNFSRYYEEELGPDLIRTWLALAGTVPPDRLLEFKRRTLEIENRLRDGAGKRQVNLDPGVLTLHNFVLATTKDYAHRIYLGAGIYAEVTLIYHRGAYQPLEWTYPDYRTSTCRDFLGACRALLLKQR